MKKNTGLIVVCIFAIAAVVAASVFLVVRNIKNEKTVDVPAPSDTEPRVVVWDSGNAPASDIPVSEIPSESGEIIPDSEDIGNNDSEIVSEPEGSEIRVSDEEIRAFFANSVFVGDSIFVGYRDYLAREKTPLASGATFLAASSYTSAHALEEDDKLHPIFRGKKQPVWENIKEMGAGHVFIMFGTNDLVVKDGIRASSDVFALIDKIHEVNPDVEVTIISMVPVYEDVSKGALNNPTIDIYNYYLLAAAADHNADFIDINTSLKDEKGNIKEEYCSDNYVHETDKAYSEVWDPALASYATEQLQGVAKEPAEEQTEEQAQEQE